MDDEIVDVVDEHNNVVGEATKRECHEKGLWHRAADILLFNKQGKLLIQKRSPGKDLNPNLMCSSASGHLQKGDSYEEGAKRELKEELGIECELTPIIKYIMEIFYSDGRIDKEHVMLFLCNYDGGEFKIDKEEVASIQFLSIDEIEEMIKKNKNQFTNGFLLDFQHFLDFIGQN
ncbi:MAG: NUDIX domain-containing protein [Candidatus Aenigmatarchaeota archaeon]